MTYYKKKKQVLYDLLSKIWNEKELQITYALWDISMQEPQIPDYHENGIFLYNIHKFIDYGTVNDKNTLELSEAGKHCQNIITFLLQKH